MNFTRNELVLIVGSSVRAAAWSARRAGLRVVAVDQFGDSDLLEMCDFHERWEEDRSEIVESLLNRDDISAWLYTGGLENHPDLLKHWAQLKPLWGNPEEVVRKVRDPFKLQSCLQAAGFPCLQLCRSYEELSAEHQWVSKQKKSGGGIQVQHAGLEMVPENSDAFFQEYRTGMPISLSGFAAKGQFRPLGYVRQLINSEVKEGGAGEELPFLFCGGIVLENLPSSVLQQTKAIGDRIVKEFGLVGLFGIDFILDEQGQAWLLEVNPRYTATMELLERQQNCSFMALQTGCFKETELNPAIPSSNSERLSYAKRIVYTKYPFQAPETKFWLEWQQDHPEVESVDIPSAGEAISSGEPVCSLIIRGTTESWRIKPIEEIVGRFQQRLQEQAILLDGSKM